MYSGFNPRARTERDSVNFDRRKLSAEFQSTRSHGARRYVINAFWVDFMFQSTRSHGARLTDDRGKDGDI